MCLLRLEQSTKNQNNFIFWGKWECAFAKWHSFGFWSTVMLLTRCLQKKFLKKQEEKNIMHTVSIVLDLVFRNISRNIYGLCLWQISGTTEFFWNMPKTRSNLVQYTHFDEQKRHILFNRSIFVGRGMDLKLYTFPIRSQ